jgi:tetratricopeptide (TPR) repeat protein
MYCTDCGSRNPTDSKYCRECGRKILSLEDEARLSNARGSKSVIVDTPPEPADEPEKLRHLLDMAFWHNEVGNFPGAILACEAALKLDPNSTSALSLLGCLYEKQGNDEKAIENFEKVVHLNPDSVADYEKLEHLVRGIRVKAVTPSLVHQLTPPVLLQAARRYPRLPTIVSICIAALLLGFGVKVVWDNFEPRGVSQSESAQAFSGIKDNLRATNQLYDDPTESSQPSVAATPQTVAQTPPSTVTAPDTSAPSPVTSDPFVAPRPGLLDQIAGTQNSQAGVESNQSAPSLASVSPLTLPDSAIPTHVVPVDAEAGADDHVVEVNSQSASAQTQSNTETASPATPDDDASDPPPSHIYINVHGGSGYANSGGASTVPSDTSIHGISLHENAGASLQQKGLNLQDAGNYKAAEAAYESAIAAYQEDISDGRSADEAKRGIEACRVAVEICKQSE